MGNAQCSSILFLNLFTEYKIKAFHSSLLCPILTPCWEGPLCFTLSAFATCWLGCYSSVILHLLSSNHEDCLYQCRKILRYIFKIFLTPHCSHKNNHNKIDHFSIFLFLITCLCLCLPMDLGILMCPWRPAEDIGSPKAVVTGEYKQPNLGTGN